MMALDSLHIQISVDPSKLVTALTQARYALNRLGDAAAASTAFQAFSEALQSAMLSEDGWTLADESYWIDEDSQSPPSLCPPGSICEQCFDDSAMLLRSSPWGGDMGVCRACADCS